MSPVIAPPFDGCRPTQRLTIFIFPIFPCDEKQTGEVLLRVVAQFAFRPGCGQPTLLWLDSVSTLRSTQKQVRGTDDATVDENGAFMQLTTELGEANRGWTTFFPPKLADLTGGASSSAAGTGVSVSVGQRASSSIHGTDALATREQISSGLLGSITGAVPFPAAAGGQAEEPARGTAPTVVPAMDKGGEELSAPYDAAISLFHNSGTIGDGGSIPGAKAGTSNARSAGRAGQRQHFTLSTESWARRSAGWRGLYFVRERGDGRAERPSSEQWPRKKSTGTTMRSDGRRPGLRTASEAQRPWTAEARVSEGMETRARGAEGDRVCGAISRHLASRANG